jgi:hypothetical protein
MSSIRKRPEHVLLAYMATDTAAADAAAADTAAVDAEAAPEGAAAVAVAVMAAAAAAVSGSDLSGSARGKGVGGPPGTRAAMPHDNSPDCTLNFL